MVDLENYKFKVNHGPNRPYSTMAVFNNENGSLALIDFYLFKMLVSPRKGVVNIDVILQTCRRRKVADNPYSETWNM